MTKKKVANVIILDDNDQFLIIKRTKTAPSHPLHWDLPGGHVEEGESFEEAAVREALEETNLEVSDLQPAKVPDSFRNFFITKKYSGNIEFKENPESGFIEHNDYKWVTLEKYKKMEDLSIKSEDIEKAMENLSKKSLYEQKYQERLELFLMEGRKENVFKKYASLPKDSLDALAVNDEEHNYKHLGWMAKQLAAVPDLDKYNINAQFLEARDIVNAVDKFVEYRPRLKRKDLNQYKNIEDIDMAIHTDIIMPRIAKSKKERGEDPQTAMFTERGEGTIIYEDDRYFVVRPDTMEASCFFGKKTRWCIAQPGNSYFDQYTGEEQKIFYFIKDDGLRADDDFRQMAVQMGVAYGDEVAFEMFWDRFDEPYEERTQDWEEFAEHVHQESGMALSVAEKIMEAIYDHAEDNPPAENPFYALNVEVEDNNAYDTRNITFYSRYDRDNSPQTMEPYGDARVVIDINERLQNLLEEPYIDWEGDETNLEEILMERLEEVLTGRESQHIDYRTGEETEYPEDFVTEWYDEIGISEGEISEDSLDINIVSDKIYVSFTVIDPDPNSFMGRVMYDHTEAQFWFSSMSRTFADDADFSGLSDMIYQLMPEMITGSRAMADIIQSFSEMAKDSKDLDIVVNKVDQYNSNVTMKAKFDLPVPDYYKDFGYNTNEIAMQDQLETIITESLKEIWTRATRTAKNQLKLQFGDKYQEEEVDMNMPEFDLRYIDGSRRAGFVRVWLGTQIKFIDTPEEMYTAYSFFKFITNNYDKLAMTFAREFNREIEIMKKRIGGEPVPRPDDDIVPDTV